MTNLGEHARHCYAEMLCVRPLAQSLRGIRMGGDSNTWCLAAHTLSRRAQSTALSPILLTPALAHTPAHVQLPIRRGAGFTAAAGGTIHRAATECRQKIHRNPRTPRLLDQNAFRKRFFLSGKYRAQKVSRPIRRRRVQSIR